MYHQNQYIQNMPDRHVRVKPISGSMETGAGTDNHMYMFRGLVIGRDQDKDILMFQADGRRHHVENIGQKVTGRKSTVKKIIGRIITEILITAANKNKYPNFRAEYS